MILLATRLLGFTTFSWSASLRKVVDGKKEEKKENVKRMSFIVATYVVASRPPKRRPTAYANLLILKLSNVQESHTCFMSNFWKKVSFG